MSKKILMVDGYDYKGWKSLNDCDCIDAFKHYTETLKSISSKPLEVVTIHPGKKEEYLPKGVSLEDFDGIVWTGSSLNIYDFNPAIIRQIELIFLFCINAYHFDPESPVYVHVFYLA